MLRLFIVDDEPDTREGLRYYFDWEKYGIEVIGEADDGSTALEAVLALNPDIVLTDVKMPSMDGIQLANKLREKDSKAKIIFISGYDDAAYLKSALKLDAVDYILKPIDMNELGTVIEKITKVISVENNQRDQILRMNLKLKQSMPMLREKFFMTLIRDGISNSSDIGKKIEFLELELSNDDEYCVFVISIDDRAAMFEGMPERDKQLLSFSVINICEELINIDVKGYCFENRPGEYVCILRLQCYEGEDNLYHADEDKLYALISDIKDSLQKFLYLSVTIGVGLSVQGLENISRSYSKAFENVSQKLFLGKNKIITIDSLETEDEYTYKFDSVRIQKLENALKSADEESLRSTVNDIFMEMTRYRNADKKYYQNICLQLILIASRLLIEFQIDLDDSELKENEVWDSLFKLETLEDMRLLIEKYFVLASRYILEKRNKKSRNVIEQIKGVIHKRYKENISVAEIAKEVYLSTTYLCMVFKQETGETVNDYITKVRIEKAKELLKDSRNKSYDICYEIGYTEPGYFSKLFKKHTGLSPTEYRNSLT